jgi:hypothetical protein
MCFQTINYSGWGHWRVGDGLEEESCMERAYAVASVASKSEVSTSIRNGEIKQILVMV